jgi:twitching motility protein PilI
MGQVVEMMEVPSSTRLPGVEPWVIGLSNVRGRLLPLFDFAAFLGGILGQQRRYHRVLVLETQDLFSGLVVERALGMQYFEVSQYRNEVKEELPDRLKPYINGSYQGSDQQSWLVLDFLKLAADSRFVNAALI